MKSLLLTFLLGTSLLASSKVELEKDLNSLSLNQRYNLMRTYYDSQIVTKNHKERILLSAISWKESSFGVNLVSSTNDYGTYQINLNSFKRRFADEIKKMRLSEEQVKRFLKHNHILGLNAAYAELSYWKKRHKGDMKKVVASYNDGSKITSIGRKYSDDVFVRAEILEKYLKEQRN